MDNMDLKQLVIEKYDSKNLKNVEFLLESQGLKLDQQIEYIEAIVDDNKFVAVGGFDGKVLKCIAVDDDYKGTGLSNKIVSRLVSEEYVRKNTDLFIFTKPKNLKVFSDMGFYKIEEVKDKVILLENDPNGIKKYMEELKKSKKEGKIISSIVLNCNPFTLGHKYLIEKASSESDVLHIFVVSEDESVFPFKIRYSLVERGTQHLKNVVLHKAGNYIISKATFPTYFIKKPSDAIKSQAILDIKIFGRYIVNALLINKRYVGEEKKLDITSIYNETMKELLPQFGVEVKEIQRLRVKGDEVSASNVRNLIIKGSMSKVKDLVPDVTYNFLVSEVGKRLIKNIQKNNQ